MLGIYVAAIVTTVFSLLIVGSIILAGAAKKDRPFLALAALLNVALSPLAFHLVRLPLDGQIQKLLDPASGLYKFLITFYAPLTEEPAKLWPLLIPWFVRKITPENAVRFAMALGLGFGLGEIWLLAEQIAHVPDYAAMPWYLLSGFLNERFLVCIFHGAFTAAALWRLRRKFIWGLLLAMGLHYLGNFPIYLASVDVLGFGAAAWQIILSLWLIVYFMAMLVLLAYFAFGKLQPGRLIFGRAQCPECGAVYPRPLFGVNLGLRRYEKCPSCGKRHITKRYKGPVKRGGDGATHGDRDG